MFFDTQGNERTDRKYGNNKGTANESSGKLANFREQSMSTVIGQPMKGIAEDQMVLNRK